MHDQYPRDPRYCPGSTSEECSSPSPPLGARCRHDRPPRRLYRRVRTVLVARECPAGRGRRPAAPAARVRAGRATRRDPGHRRPGLRAGLGRRGHRLRRRPDLPTPVAGFGPRRRCRTGVRCGHRRMGAKRDPRPRLPASGAELARSGERHLRRPVTRHLLSAVSLRTGRPPSCRWSGHDVRRERPPPGRDPRPVRRGDGLAVVTAPRRDRPRPDDRHRTRRAAVLADDVGGVAGGVSGDRSTGGATAFRNRRRRGALRLRVRTGRPATGGGRPSRGARRGRPRRLEARQA